MTEFVIKEGGSIFRRDTTEREIEMGDRLVAQLTTNAIARCFNIFNLANHEAVHQTIVGANAYYTIEVKGLRIRAPWHPLAEGILVPNFSSKTDPLTTILWEAPKDMTLKIMIATQLYEKMKYFVGMWLFAFDSKGVSWRLPLSNLHDDCSVCTGIIADSPDIYHKNDHALVGRVMEIFETSRYNADLWKNSEVTQRMFRVKPGDKDTFTTLPPILEARRDWTSLCIKIANAVTRYAL